MVKKGDDKIGKIGSTTETGSVKKSAPVEEIARVKPTSGVGAVRGAGAIGKRRATRIMSQEEREQIFQMISEEAEKMVAEGKLPTAKKEVLTSAVKMAVDAGLIPAEEEEKKK